MGGKDSFEGRFERKESGLWTPTAVKQLHAKSDVDSGPFAQHHTIGLRKDQASSGAHSHDGKDSKFIFEGKSVSGSKGGNVALASVISVLVSLGLTDNTT